MIEKEKCKCCGKENKIYKLGYCTTCYNLILSNKYVLNPETKFISKNSRDMIEYFLDHPNIDKEKLAKMFNVSVSTVYANIKKHIICLKVEK